MSVRATIFALSSAPGRAGVAVLRLSGPRAAAAARALSGAALPPPREVRLRRFRDAAGDTIDRGLLLWLPAPRSFTGEDLAEFHIHGGRAVIDAMVGALTTLPGLRPAEAGEFTRRAFDAGRLNLTEVEGLADLIEAETAAQRRQALRQMDGGLARRVEGWRAQLLHALAHMEAVIDFADEDLPAELNREVRDRIAALATDIEGALNDGRRGERLREGLSVAIVGAPNVGKSSLLNALARRDAAIVAETAGTTRDIVEVHLDLGGYPLTLADTAGLRPLESPGDGIEAEGMRRARARAAAADLTMAVFDASAAARPDPETRALLRDGALVVLNKCDLGAPAAAVMAEFDRQRPVVVSARTGQGLDRLMASLERAAVERLGVEGAAPAITRARHRASLEETAAALRRALIADAPELLAEDLRLATRALGRVTGSVDVEDLLDTIFRDFCIGK